MSKRRNREQMYVELRAFCVRPQPMQLIIRKINLTHAIIVDAVNDGVIEKVGEKNIAWNGPPSHIYQSVLGEDK